MKIDICTSHFIHKFLFMDLIYFSGKFIPRSNASAVDVRVVSLMVLLMLMMLLLVGVSCAPMIINYDGGGFTCRMDAH